MDAQNAFSEHFKKSRLRVLLDKYLAGDINMAGAELGKAREGISKEAGEDVRRKACDRGDIETAG